MNIDAVVATWKRQLGNLLWNPLGYVFILVFVLVAAGFMFLPDSYFSRNIADLGPWLTIMPWLLVVLLPSLAMGSWATERELGTEEQLLTLPIAISDAILGKWLGVVSFFTVALLVSGWEAIVVAWLGKWRPDWGLIFSNYLGWWCAGMIFASVSLVASTLVSLPSIAFVLGVLFSAAVAGVFWACDWFDTFNRGLVPLGGLVVTAVLCFLFLGLACLILSSRRWQKIQRAAIFSQSVIVGCFAITLVNLSVQADRRALDLDVSSEGLSRLSAASREVLGQVAKPIKLVAFISKELPSELSLKGKEVENMLKVLDREMGDKIQLELNRPGDALDGAGVKASTHYGLKPKKVAVEAVAGKEDRDIFLGVVVQCAGNTQRIDYFDPGLSVEYELIRAIRTVSAAKKKVLGIVSTDLKMLGGFDFQARQSRPEWQLVQEWRKQYEVRDVNLDVEVAKDVDVLVAPQPSRLNDDQLHRLHDYIWAGRPCLILEDPLPWFNDPALGSSQPKKPPQQPMMMGMPPPPSDEKTGDMKPLLAGLGLSMELDKVVWSDFNPSWEFRNRMPPSWVWTFRDRGGVKEAMATTGIDSLLLPMPGMLRVSPQKDPEVEVKPLIAPIEGLKWGQNEYKEYQGFGFFGPQPQIPEHFKPGYGDPPFFAAEIQGKMRRKYEGYAPEKKPEEDKDKEKDPKKKEEPKSDKPAPKMGELSLGDIHVVFVADTDLASDQFFFVYRNETGEFSKDNWKFLLNLRNVQFLSNAVDALVGDKAFLELRTRKPEPRPLVVIENVLLKTRNQVRQVEEQSEAEAEGKIKKLRDDFAKRLEKIKEQPELDENAKRQKAAQVEKSTQRLLDADIDQVNLEKKQKIQIPLTDQKREIEGIYFQVRLVAMAVPSFVLILMAVSIFAYRLHGERLIVPQSRKRSF